MASVWRTPIFDRTHADVAFAIQKIAEWTAYNISAAEYDAKVRIENEELILREGYATATNDKLVLQGDGRAYVENDAVVVRLGVAYDLKGCLNLLDINRIEGNIAYLAEKISELVYPSNLFIERATALDERGQPIEIVYEVSPSNISTRQWEKDNLPTESDTQRIIANVRSLVDSFYQHSDAPILPTEMLGYSGVNAIERNIDLIKYLLDCMVGSFKKVGAYKCGATYLPLRR
jgi:hypothetical protein